MIKENFSAFEVKFAVLLVDEETLLFRDSQRDEDCQMKERCIVLLNNFKNRNYDRNSILDTSDLSVDETVDIIENDERFVI